MISEKGYDHDHELHYKTRRGYGSTSLDMRLGLMHYPNIILEIAIIMNVVHTIHVVSVISEAYPIILGVCGITQYISNNYDQFP